MTSVLAWSWLAFLVVSFLAFLVYGMARGRPWALLMGMVIGWLVMAWLTLAAIREVLG